MDESGFVSNNVFLNYYSFGSLLLFLTSMLISGVFLFIDQKVSSTKHLAIGTFFLGIFQFGYVISTFLYHPFAAYHRWITVGFILPAILHIGQFIARYPENDFPKFNRITTIVLWSIALFSIGYFCFSTWNASVKYYFTAHRWDFNAEDVNSKIAIIVFSYMFINFLAIPIWRMIHLRGKTRWVVFTFMMSFLIGGTALVIANLLGNDGYLERSIYFTSIVFLFMIAFFIILILYLNFSVEKTSFMLEIVGITFVTVLIVMQILIYISNEDKEFEYDTLSRIRVEKALEGESVKGGISYVFKWNNVENSFDKERYDPKVHPDQEQIEIDFKNTLLYEEMFNLSENGFRESLLELMDHSHENFGGYKYFIVNFLAEHPNLEDKNLKLELSKELSRLNLHVITASNKLDNIFVEDFCTKGKNFLENYKILKMFQIFLEYHWSFCKSDGEYISPTAFKEKILNYFRPFVPSFTRYYRGKSVGDYNFHYIGFIKYDRERNDISEVGFSYRAYREFVHPTALKQIIVLSAVIVTIVFLFPFFFRASLFSPLKDLLSGVEAVNGGNLEVQVPIRTKDEIGFLASSFNNMVFSICNARKELRDYANYLAAKVRFRTEELSEKIEELQNLKIQQDGDYFLTSLLAKPLNYNANKSTRISTQFLLRQKKQFEFKGKQADLGGDICITGNLRLGTSSDYKRYVFAMNGDAMGKSMQGAGGALVIGVIVNSILTRSAADDRILDISPEQWLTEMYEELNSVFKSFDGSMVVSASFFLIEENSGKTYYFNAEHPFTVLYRGERAIFLESSLTLRKIGLESEYAFQVFTTTLREGDVLIVGSDGKDDLNLTPNKDVRSINEDETLFLKIVEAGKGDIEQIEQLICKKGEIIDDLSLLRIEYGVPQLNPEKNCLGTESEGISDWNISYSHARQLYRNGNVKEAIDKLMDLYSKTPEDSKVIKLLGLLSFKDKDYVTAVETLGKYLELNSELSEYWYYFSIANKKLGRFSEAISASEKVAIKQPNNINNLVNLSDLYRLQREYVRAKEIAIKILDLDPQNENAKKILKEIENKI
ncbi:SpoIIE family protein phosphatase [Leptospira borgpetersenii]|uniref:Stage II sporulation protein E n=2 Tax=Leptospira borgpetersenii TaxID=174 RepID=M3HNJ0_LEPBO|nr:SpoIIE family protein phosphatase [Leptospira borgpetersenii]EKP13180.1 stage II sporulation protein E [Leptospira borgpetersenii str. 200801926]EMF99630.1 stage II sporulation protein E [Leptospira borgpetersenii str. 200701203]ENO65367.1 stage II sporulation protein E [Leptospira borgpetersenii serovar Mini str. 201000851]